MQKPVIVQILCWEAAERVAASGLAPAPVSAVWGASGAGRGRDLCVRRTVAPSWQALRRRPCTPDTAPVSSSTASRQRMCHCGGGSHCPCFSFSLCSSGACELPGGGGMDLWVSSRGKGGCFFRSRSQLCATQLCTSSATSGAAGELACIFAVPFARGRGNVVALYAGVFACAPRLAFSSLCVPD